MSDMLEVGCDEMHQLIMQGRGQDSFTDLMRDSATKHLKALKAVRTMFIEAENDTHKIDLLAEDCLSKLGAGTGLVGGTGNEAKEIWQIICEDCTLQMTKLAADRLKLLVMQKEGEARSLLSSSSSEARHLPEHDRNPDPKSYPNPNSELNVKARDLIELLVQESNGHITHLTVNTEGKEGKEGKDGQAMKDAKEVKEGEDSKGDSSSTSVIGSVSVEDVILKLTCFINSLYDAGQNKFGRQERSTYLNEAAKARNMCHILAEMESELALVKEASSMLMKQASREDTSNRIDRIVYDVEKAIELEGTAVEDEKLHLQRRSFMKAASLLAL